MARRRRSSSAAAGGASGAAQYFKLEQRLLLLAWLNGHFGYEHNRDLLAEMIFTEQLTFATDEPDRPFGSPCEARI